LQGTSWGETSKCIVNLKLETRNLKLRDKQQSLPLFGDAGQPLNASMMRHVSAIICVCKRSFVDSCSLFAALRLRKAGRS